MPLSTAGDLWQHAQVARRQGYAGGLSLGMAATVVVLLVNLGLLIYAARQPSSTLGTRILYQGDCDYVASRSTVTHLAINVMGTLLLAASNAAMQCLTAPTREMLDSTHARGRWLDIGIGSLRNLVHVGIRRQLLWGMLLVSSLPLHLLYNSVILQATSASEFVGVLATQDFAARAPFNNNTYGWAQEPTPQTSLSAIAQIQAEAHTYAQLSVADCLTYYGSPFVKERSNVVLVTNYTTGASLKVNSSVLGVTYFAPFVQSLNYSWFYPTGLSDDQDSLEWDTSPYIINGVMPFAEPFEESTPNQYGIARIESCLSKELPGNCQIEFYIPFMVVVIICNLIKLGCFTTLLYGFDFTDTLLTIGDALASFLIRPDPYTEGGRAIARDVFEGGTYTRVQKDIVERGSFSVRGWPWKAARMRRNSGLGALQSFLTFATCLVWAAGGGALLGLVDAAGTDGKAPTSLATLWTNGFGNPYPEDIVQSTVGHSLAANILLANTPQLVLSLFYLFFNQDLTCLCISSEMAAFSHERKYLRVSRPAGKQRSTYWLGMPYRYSIPLLVSAAIMHWAASQGVFLTEISVVDPNGTVLDNQHINAVGYSLLGILIMYIVGWTLILALLVTRLWHLPAGMPVMGSCSLAISAACHGQGDNPVDPEQPLQYGMTEITGEKSAIVGFYDNPVEPLREGWDYNGEPKAGPRTGFPQLKSRQPDKHQTEADVPLLPAQKG